MKIHHILFFSYFYMVAAKGRQATWWKKIKNLKIEKIYRYRFSQIEMESPQWRQIKSPAETVTLPQASVSAEEAGIPARRLKKDHFPQ